MTQRGIVIQEHTNYTEISVVKTSMCGDSCASCKGGCATQTQRVQAVNETGEKLSPGDVVQLETETGKIIGISAAVYLVPLFWLFVAYMIAQSFTANELICALVALAAMLLSLFLTVLLDRYIKRKNALLVRITDILLHKDA